MAHQLPVCSLYLINTLSLYDGPLHVFVMRCRLLSRVCPSLPDMSVTPVIDHKLCLHIHE